ncbi:MAG: SGNH/GDSL hydrolase family protein [Vicinamibacteria bacterium]|nr:SGNH/GDSL hydrolase family protein [Vicinamibacteria bacterium]
MTASPFRLRRFFGEPLFNIALATSATLAVLFALEIGFRARAYLADLRILNESVAKRPRLSPGDEADLVDIIRLSPNDRIIYELIPGIETTFMSAPLTINRHGFRGRDVPENAPPGVLRIVGLGDSIMFGWGVRDEDGYLSVLSRRLAERNPGVRSEIVNTAVPGYNTVMEIETLKTKGLRFNPDLVVLGFCGNDVNLPYFIRDREEYLSFRKSFLGLFVRERLARGSSDYATLEESTGLARWTAPNREAWDGFASSDAHRVPARYRDMVGLAAFERAMEDLRELGNERRFHVAVVFFPTARRQAAEIAARLDFLVVNARFAVEGYMSRHGIERFAGSVLTIGPADPHPSALGHELIADLLLESVESAGWLDRFTPESAPGSR